MKSTTVWGNGELKTASGLSLEGLIDKLKFYAAVVQIGTYTGDRGKQARDKGQEK